MNLQPIPAVADPRPFTAPRLVRHRLSNGLDVICVPKTGLPVVDVLLVARGGATLDRPRQAGRAGLAAEVMDEGTRNYSALELSDRIEFLGADFELQAGWDATYLAMHGLVPRISGMLDLLAEVLLEPTFPQEEFERKHEERMNLLLQQRDDPRAVATRAVARAVFGDEHVYGWPLSGTTDSIAGLQRTDLIEYREQGFVPTRVHLLVVGQIEPDQILRELELRFGAWSVSAGNPPTAGAPPVRARSVHLINRPLAPQSEVRVGHVGPARNTPDYFATLVLNTVLGGSFRSRLNLILREEKGFTYGASSAFSFRRAGGFFSAGAAVFTDNTAETIEILVREITRIREDGLSIAELERARRYLALGFVRTFETTSDIAGHLADLALHDLGEQHLQTYAERVGAVTMDDVTRAAQHHLEPERLSIVVVGDRARVLEPLQRLEAGEVLEWEAE